MDGGVTINRPPRDGHMAFVRSPDGISIELLQEGGSLPPAGAVGLDAEHRQLVDTGHARFRPLAQPLRKNPFLAAGRRYASVPRAWIGLAVFGHVPEQQRITSPALERKPKEREIPFLRPHSLH